MLQTSDGGLIVAGYTASRGNGSGDIYLIKTGPQGELQREKTYGGPYDDLAISIAKTRDGGFLVAGESGGNAGKATGLLVKTDRDGNVEWQQTHGADRDVFVRSGVPTMDGGLALFGSTGDKGDVETWDVYLARLRPV